MDFLINNTTMLDIMVLERFSTKENILPCHYLLITLGVDIMTQDSIFIFLVNSENHVQFSI